jgi:Mrp family chromosome partitioning ATPase
MQAHTPNSSDILASSELRTLVAELRKTYDYVVVDLPPTAPIVDVRSTAGLVDAYVFVVEWAHTKLRVAEFALEKTPVVRANLLGIILNKVDFKRLGRYDSHRSDYYSDKYYAQYGDPQA